jgi:hypothetical protein
MEPAAATTNQQPKKGQAQAKPYLPASQSFPPSLDPFIVSSR